MDYLQNGVPVSYFAEGEQRSALVHLVDNGNVANNSFVVANQWTVVGNSEKRPDVVVFVLKSPSHEEADASEAFLQLRNYLHEIPSLFVYNAFLVMSDLAVSKAGTITAGEDRFIAWKTKDGRYENTQVAQFDTFVEGIFEKVRLLDILRNFICFPVRTRRFSARTINILRCARPRRPPCRRQRRTGAGASSGTRSP